jgi:hypothetical protein
LPISKNQGYLIFTEGLITTPPPTFAPNILSKQILTIEGNGNLVLKKNAFINNQITRLIKLPGL